jgi:stalled ribosome rescue protein Dom34
MATYVIWLDSEKAHVFNLKPTGVEKSHLEKKGMDHHTHNKKDHHHDSAPDHFFHELAIRISDAKEILLMGPGLGKNHFQTHLEKHHAPLSKKVVGVESSDHPTDNQVLATARKFFKTYDLFDQPVKTL